MNSRASVAANVVLLIMHAIGGPLVAARMSWAQEDQLLEKSLILVLVFAAAVVAQTTFISLIGLHAKWKKPSLRRPFYLINDPLQMAFLGGLGGLAASFGCAISLLWGGHETAWLLFLDFGIGILLGSYIAGLAYVDRGAGA